MDYSWQREIVSPAPAHTSAWHFLTAARSRPILISCAIAISAIYLLGTFDGLVLLGVGPFWAHPVGPWLMDPTDTMINGDLLDVLVGYRAFLHSGWHLPLLFVRDLGPSGTNVLLLGAIPLVALAGKTLSIMAGSPVNPYGGWLVVCFILSAVFATLVVVELGQRSLLAACAASLLAISAPPLLHRFGHLTYMAHFIAIGALFLYLRDPRVNGSWARSLDLDRVALSRLVPRCLSFHDVHRSLRRVVVATHAC